MDGQPRIQQQSSAADTEVVSNDQEEDTPPQCIGISGVYPEGVDHRGKLQQQFNASGQESSKFVEAEVGTEEAEHSTQEDQAGATDRAGCSSKASIHDKSIHGLREALG